MQAYKEPAEVNLYLRLIGATMEPAINLSLSSISVTMGPAISELGDRVILFRHLLTE